MKQPWGNTWGKEELSLAVLHLFEDLQEFIDLNLLQALMQFLRSFPPPWWAKKIDQIDDGSLLPAILLPVQLHSFPVNGHMLHAVPPPPPAFTISTSGTSRTWSTSWPQIGTSTRAGPAEDLLRNMSPSRFLRIMGMIWPTPYPTGTGRALLTDNCLYFEYVAYKEPGGIISQEN